MTRAEFYDIHFKNCEFLGVDLAASDFWRCEFFETTFNNTNLKFSIAEDVKLCHLNKFIEIKSFQ